MDIIISSLGFRHSTELETYINERLEKLTPLAHDIIRANVTLFKGAESEREDNYTEIRLEIPGNDPFVKKNADSFEHSVNECVDALQTILRKHKEKITDHQQGK